MSLLQFQNFVHMIVLIMKVMHVVKSSTMYLLCKFYFLCRDQKGNVMLNVCFKNFPVINHVAVRIPNRRLFVFFVFVFQWHFIRYMQLSYCYSHLNFWFMDRTISVCCNVPFIRCKNTTPVCENGHSYLYYQPEKNHRTVIYS